MLLTTRMLEDRLSTYENPCNKIGRMVSADELVPVRRGLYETDRTITGYEVGLYDTPSLFAGKVHVVIARAWRSRVKGRDLYDYVFYRARRAQVNLAHLEAKLRQTGQLSDGETLDIEGARQLLRGRFESIDYAQAKADVMPFVTDSRALDLWSADFFCAITEGLEEAPRLI